MKTAQRIPRIGLARAKGEHLNAANERQVKDGNRVGLMDPDFIYVPAASTDIRGEQLEARSGVARDRH